IEANFKIRNYLNSVKIATDTVYVERPTIASGLSIVVQGRPAVGYEYDWDDGGSGTSVVSQTTNQIVINTVIPIALSNALALSGPPRIQLQLTGLPLPLVCRVTAYIDDSPMSGQATLTLDATPAVLPTTMYAGGSAVIPVATALLNYVDNLGPSKQS